MNVIIHQLKEMNLEGMRQALILLKEAGEYQSEDFIPLLTHLINAEREYRQEKKSLALNRQARFRYNASLQTVLTGKERNLEKAQLLRLAEGRYIRQGQSLLITGPTGAGKSWVASALGQKACCQGFKTLYFNCSKLWAKLRLARRRDKYEKEIKIISKADLLILDDFGISKLEPSDRLSLLEILEDRWGKAATIVVSQRPLNTWHEILGEPTIADAICDRLFSNSEKIELKGDSLRKTHLPIASNLPLG